MMSTTAPAALGLVPAEGDPGVLLKGGPGRGRAPRMHRVTSYEAENEWCICDEAEDDESLEDALVVWLDRVVEPHGWDRLRRAVFEHPATPDGVEGFCHEFEPTRREVEVVASAAVALGYAEKLVVFDQRRNGLDRLVLTERA